MNKQKISDIISVEEIQQWSKDELVVISAQTGSGKSYFVYNKLLPYVESQGKTLLYLVNRRAVKKQIENKGSITVLTYQFLEHIDDPYEELMRYDYIVCDEYHYFISDTAFNEHTVLSFSNIMKTNRIKILMSACYWDLSQYAKKYNIKHYSLPSDWSHIININVFSSKLVNESADLFINSVPQNKKGIIFVSSAAKGVALKMKLGDRAVFCCSDGKTTSELHKYFVDEEKISNIINNEKFEEQFLITTKRLDNGINICDEDVQYIYTDIVDYNTIIQCIGRKRIMSENDFVQVFVQEYDKRSYIRFLKSIDKRIKTNVYEGFGYKKLTYLIDKEIELEKDWIGACMDLGMQEMFRNYLRDVDVCYIEEPDKYLFAKAFMLSNIGNEFAGKEEKDAFAKKLNLKVNGRLIKTARVINEFFIEHDFYEAYIKEKMTKRKQLDGTYKPVRVWEIVRTPKMY